jgi:predicted NBD/HSP70 family sugar kinase
MSVSGLAPFDRRGHQRRLILDALRRADKAARSEISSLTGLPPQVVTSLVDELVRDGLIHIVGRRPAARGQPPIDLALNLEGGFAVGVQVEVGRLSGIVADLGGHVRAEASFDCGTDDPDEALGSLRHLIEELVDQSAIDQARLWGIGIVLPGPFGAIEGIEEDPLAMPKWSQASFKARLAEELTLPVFIGNDATAAAVGEHLNGTARDLRTFFYLYLSEGIGGGLFVEGQPVLGAFGNAGETGRMYFDTGRSGTQTLEDAASLNALRRMAEQAGQREATSLPVDALLAADAEVTDAWLSNAAHYLRLAVANIENFLDPETIVIGGQVPAAYMKRLLDKMQPLIPTVSARTDRRTARILFGSAGRNSPALGGATLPLFHHLTPQPRAARSNRTARISSDKASKAALMSRTPAGRVS